VSEGVFNWNAWSHRGGLKAGKGVSTSRVSPPGPSLSLSLSVSRERRGQTIAWAQWADARDAVYSLARTVGGVV
jgi:hypothetical protein